MNYLTTAEAAKLWGISSRRVLNLAKEGRIPGVKQIGTRWMIPNNSVKPSDGRTNAAKKQIADIYRYPCFEYKDESSFNPPLGADEKLLKSATEAFYACEYTQSEKLLGDLFETAKNRYTMIAALYVRCMIDMIMVNQALFLEHYGRLTATLQEDFPHKREMAEYLHIIDANLENERYYAKEFRIDSDYHYSESFLPRLANLSSVAITFAESPASESDLRMHELNCLFLENTNAYPDLQGLHLNLGIAYGFMGNTEKSSMHLEKALAIAEKYQIYYSVAEQYYYMRKLFKPAIENFHPEFISKLHKLSKDIHDRHSSFMRGLSALSVYSFLSSSDYIFLYYAMHGLTNKEIAELLNISVGNVGKKYGEIYASLGVENKNELIELCKKGMTGVLETKKILPNDKINR